MQWIEIVAEVVRASRERGDDDQPTFVVALRQALGERSLPPDLTRVMARASAEKPKQRFSSIKALWNELDDVCKRFSPDRAARSVLPAIIGVGLAAALGFLIAYGL